MNVAWQIWRKKNPSQKDRVDIGEISDDDLRSFDMFKAKCASFFGPLWVLFKNSDESEIPFEEDIPSKKNVSNREPSVSTQKRARTEIANLRDMLGL